MSVVEQLDIRIR